MDAEMVEHTADVEAESLHEAVALAVADFREDSLLIRKPDSSTEFTVVVLRNPTEHRIRLSQVEAWAGDKTTRGGPSGVAKRYPVRELLGVARATGL